MKSWSRQDLVHPLRTMTWTWSRTKTWPRIKMVQDQDLAQGGVGKGGRAGPRAQECKVVAKGAQIKKLVHAHAAICKPLLDHGEPQAVQKYGPKSKHAWHHLKCSGSDLTRIHQDAVKKCSLTVTPTGTGATAMADAQKQVCTTASKCIKDADCCDFEKDGSKMKDLVAALCVSGGTNECA